MENKSFIDLINDDKELSRILNNYVFRINPNIKNFEDFQNAFFEAFDTDKGKNANINSDTIIKFFETPQCKDRIKDNTTKKEFEDVYGDGHAVIYTAKKDEIIKIEIPKIQSKGYSGKTKAIAQYSRTKPRKFSPVEAKFLQVRKQKKISPKQIIADYNKHFAEKGRTSSSIRTKLYRI